MRIGIRALKANLSKYLKRAANGELILVTDRGESIALLGPIPGRLNLDKGIAQKWIRPAQGGPHRSAIRTKPKLSTQAALLDDRGE
ncbi:MAG: type II toxin-antitoxin system prevent-host-death family antitoxin [Deltaproteobacteria bacterium]|nr:type II toxin-antitoxin system prevent-host-death family antitoxin [Deltaproteobacteria bacterium]